MRGYLAGALIAGSAWLLTGCPCGCKAPPSIEKWATLHENSAGGVQAFHWMVPSTEMPDNGNLPITSVTYDGTTGNWKPLYATIPWDVRWNRPDLVREDGAGIYLHSSNYPSDRLTFLDAVSGQWLSQLFKENNERGTTVGVTPQRDLVTELVSPVASPYKAMGYASQFLISAVDGTQQSLTPPLEHGLYLNLLPANLLSLMQADDYDYRFQQIDTRTAAVFVDGQWQSDTYLIVSKLNPRDSGVQYTFVYLGELANGQWTVSKLLEESTTSVAIYDAWHRYTVLDTQIGGKWTTTVGRIWRLEKDGVTGKWGLVALPHKDLYESIQKKYVESGATSFVWASADIPSVIDALGRFHTLVDEDPDERQVILAYHVYDPASATPMTPVIRVEIARKSI